MSVRKNKKGLWEVRVQRYGKRLRFGAYKTEKEALKVEADAVKKLEKNDKYTIDNLPPKYQLKLEDRDFKLGDGCTSKFFDFVEERAGFVYGKAKEFVLKVAKHWRG